ncbi:DUF6283 family protein [Acidovorax sp. LjRoot129]|uniref:DUF6283 family protein n=1 Tax=unclassified Acidovorax TaxID=2684926 RepID=UPI003ECFC96C
MAAQSTKPGNGTTAKSPDSPSRLIAVTQAGPDHQVVTLAGSGSGCYRRTPCEKCPWRVDATGEFPPEAFVHSATTAYDMATNLFACHDSGTKRPATCAGFLLRGADHNLSVRLKAVRGEPMDDVTDGGHALHANYREMAVANGVDPSHPRLKLCRD